MSIWPLFYMKALYTILFFADMLALILLFYLFFHLVNTGIGGHVQTFAYVVIAIVISMVLLVFFLHRYLKTKSPD